MCKLYVMRRANGDWFALDVSGRFRVPVFRSRRRAMCARAGHSGMSLFMPVVLDDRGLKELAPTGGEVGVCFWLVDNPPDGLGSGYLIDGARLALLITPPQINVEHG